MKVGKSALFGFALVLLSVHSIQAVPPHPDLEARLKREGKWEDFADLYKSWQGRPGAVNPNPYRARTPAGVLKRGAALVPDTLKVVVIYAAPSDRPTSADGINVSTAQLQTNLFGANPTRNMTDYYKEISYGQTVILGTVFGPYTLPETNAYYTGGSFGRGPYPNNGQKFTEDAVAAADPFVDFSQFDGDGDGAVDGLFIIHSGPGGEFTGNGNDIWSHAWTFGTPPRDGKTLNRYAIQPEQQPGPSPIQIGIFCHEAGHSLFGLPDLYDTDGSSAGLGVWCLMSGGNYLNNSRTPGHLSAWCKKEVGWLSPTNLTANQAGAAFPTVQFNPVCYRLWTNGGGGSQYFLVENRFRRGFDAFLPAGGLFIWHINEDVADNSSEPLYKVALEQADGLWELENGFGGSDGADPYPGSTGNRAFDENSLPNSKAGNLVPTQVAVTNISDSDSIMTADLQVTYPSPYIRLGQNGFIFNGIYKGTPPAARNLNVYNDGGGTLNWTAAWNLPAGWLAVSPDSGTAPTAASVSIASTDLPPGTYTDTIYISGAGALNAPQKAWVSFEVTALKGDLTRDGIRAPADVVTLITCAFNDPTGPNCELLVADMNCSGDLSPADVVELLRVVFLNWPLSC
ncbi:MAG: M6 family metalloprotease domain-containing protein [candidate division Zixibacteria bacterium]|nr:M6 family metalloprotease domain-containing protein [candidate division Zixibacteria bacterium]